MDEEGGGQLFDGVVFTTIPSDDLDVGQADALVDAVDAQGGRYVQLRQNDQQIEDLQELTHIVSTHIDFPQYNAALENGIHIVKPSWIISSVNKGKPAQPRQHSPDPSQYFHEVVITCADLPEGDQDAIVAGVIALGGQYSSPLSKLVTHIVTLDLDNEKCRIAKEKGLKCKIMLPHWFDDCFRLGRKINERPYVFPNPEILRRDNLGKVRDSHSDVLEGATVASPSGLPQSSPPPSPSETRKNLNAFMSKKILLSKDLRLTNHLHKTLEGLINHGGATLTDSVEDADIYIGCYRDGADYVKASRAGKEVANLSWLYHVINRNKYTNPLSKLLHYPIPRKGVPGCENMRISISNYTGDARVYLENLIRYCGAEFTKTMKQDNTHLITAHTQSEKCEAAQEWGINVVNHIWLEESYAKCAAQNLTIPRYTHFPARTNLGEVAGQTSFDMKRVESMFFPRPRESPQKVQPPSEPTLKTKLSPRKTVHSTATVMGSTINQGDSPMPTADDDNTEAEEPSMAKKVRGRPRKSVTTTPRFRDADKENESPLLQSSGRASKVKANDKLHEQKGDIALFQKEMKRKGGVTHGGRRSSNAAEFSSPVPEAKQQRKKRTSDEATYDVTAEGSDLSDGETQARNAADAKPTKKAKTAPAPAHLPPVRYKMMVTGDDRWVDNVRKEAADRQKLRDLGVMLTQDPKDVQILCAPKILRTRKFVAALAGAPMVVDSKYLDTALKQSKLVENPPTLHDRDTEERFGFTLSDSLERAKINQRRLLRGWTIFVTNNVAGGFETYKEIITLNGGVAMLYTGRIGLTLPRLLRAREDPEASGESQHQGGEEELEKVYLVSNITEADVKLWPQFRAVARKQGLEARIVKTDWLLNAAMSQEVKWDAKWAVDGEDGVGS
ncbi:regulator of Ty1 Transposition [Vermiconidia calcicola]|uniref:Regulator of Ty1 Transposition n=1 Tax=Vermiconidia calcicola TaxID=1690605 RepID=A0ACC3NZ36_9PEZI|nr:regulator of Ty1 Transposition [Vermiconidia calcicola]